MRRSAADARPEFGRLAARGRRGQGGHGRHLPLQSHARLGHNLSGQDRWQIYSCYNRVANHPHDVENPRPDYVRSRNWTPLALAGDDAILEAGLVHALAQPLTPTLTILGRADRTYQSRLNRNVYFNKVWRS